MFVSIDKMKKKPGEENLKDLVVNPSFWQEKSLSGPVTIQTFPFLVTPSLAIP